MDLYSLWYLCTSHTVKVIRRCARKHTIEKLYILHNHYHKIYCTKCNNETLKPFKHVSLLAIYGGKYDIDHAKKGLVQRVEFSDIF